MEVKVKLYTILKKYGDGKLRKSSRSKKYRKFVFGTMP